MHGWKKQLGISWASPTAIAIWQRNVSYPSFHMTPLEKVQKEKLKAAYNSGVKRRTGKFFSLCRSGSHIGHEPSGSPIKTRLVIIVIWRIVHWNSYLEKVPEEHSQEYWPRRYGKGVPVKSHLQLKIKHFQQNSSEEGPWEGKV
ncbi:hypothetical protein CEXT_777451 [Caerostris extrusa]|uniref:Uncharacterized protein n=1 Tax=Caerostris extrusa TaxID=172846 RepID=A0AAV4YD04_CAEEX|nr:hypothetical protein CEXT_777451 [Caerostris extrusa]